MSVVLLAETTKILFVKNNNNKLQTVYFIAQIFMTYNIYFLKSLIGCRKRKRFHLNWVSGSQNISTLKDEQTDVALYIVDYGV